MNEYDIPIADSPALITEMYQDISDEYKIDNLDLSFLRSTVRTGEVECPRLLAVFSLLCENFNLYYATREIGGLSEYDFFCMMQSCLNRNADTFERQLAVYDDDIANPILGRTEVVEYDTTDKRNSNTESSMGYGLVTERENTGTEKNRHVEYPYDGSEEFDRDRSRDYLEFENRKTTDRNSGTDKGTNKNDETRTMKGTVTTKLSDLGVRPNYESLNGFLDNNRSFIQEFIDKFEECFSPRYRRVFF